MHFSGIARCGRRFVVAIVFGLCAAVVLQAEQPKDKADRSNLIRDVKAPAGFDVTLFAAPPDVSYPTCLAASPDGVVFVGVDLNGSLGARPNRGKVVRCVDTDGDGKADKFNVFTEVDSPRGLWWDDKTLYVLHPPFLSAYHDDDGDGVADRHDILVNGIGFDLKFRGADHTTNGIRVGIDGWIYVAVGDYGFVKAVGKDGATKQLRGGGIARVRTDGTGLEIVCDGLRNIYDVAISPELDIFTRDNTNDGGGWDVRLAHNIPTGHYGYPRLFTHFPDEIIKPLFDYGGGSPTGSIFIDEPGYPGGFGHGLYTCEWGRSEVDYHPLSPHESTFKVDKKTFLRIPRPTDIDVDGSGRMYLSSWREGGFDFSSPEVGFVVRVTPPGWKPRAFPDMNKASDEELLGYLTSNSGVWRQYAQRAILRRGEKPIFAERLEQLAVAENQPIAVRVAAIFTLKQLVGEKANAALNRLLKHDAVRAYALKALADNLTQIKDVPTEPYVESLRNPDPRVRLQAAIGLNRLHRASTAAALLPLTADKDPVIAHVAVNALVSLDAAEVCLKALDSADAALYPGALRVLQDLHEPAVVDGLLNRLSKAEPQLRQGIIRTLARLYQREADWKGDWWSTRPDTRGPYYNPVQWQESNRIYQALRDVAATADAEGLRWLIPVLLRNRIDMAEVADKLLELASKEPAFQELAIEFFRQKNPLPEKAIALFMNVASDPKQPQSLQERALRSLLRYADNTRIRDVLIDVLTRDAKLPGEMGRAWDDFARDGRHVSEVKQFAAMTASESEPKRQLAWGVLATIADRNLGDKDARAVAEAAINGAWGNPRAAVPLLRAIGRLNLTSYAPQIRALLHGTDRQVAATAKATLESLRIDPQARNLPLIGKLSYDEAVEQTLKEKGDAAAGAKIFQRTGCINCHTITTSEPLKGPLLAGITARYSRKELLESILKPSAKIAQGFETQILDLNDGKKLSGFVVKESGSEIELRDSNGGVVSIKKSDIDERRTSPTSVMPEKLVDNLTAPELASILAYLESLKPKQ